MNAEPKIKTEKGIAETVFGEDERFVKLSMNRSYFFGTQYSHLRYDWDGCPTSSGDIASHLMESAGYGYGNPNDKVPLRMRRPDTKFPMGGPIVEQFSDLLFSEDRRPKPQSANKKDQSYIRGQLQLSSFWEEVCIDLRDMGGSTGSVGLAFHYEEGELKFTILDARYTTPKFKKKNCLDVESVTIMFLYDTVEMKAKKDSHGKTYQKPTTVTRWFKREISAEADIMYDNPEYKKGEAPSFKVERKVSLPFRDCPVVWFHNIPLRGEFDGLPDYHLSKSLFRKIDTILSQVSKGTAYNVDPTVHIATDRQVDKLVTGSFDSIKTEANGKVNLLELRGDGIRTAMDVCEKYEQKAQLLSRCVIVAPETNDRDRVTATEIGRRDMAMFARASRLRGSYGKGLQRLFRLLCQSAFDFQKGSIVEDEDGQVLTVRQVIEAPEGFEAMPASDRPNFTLRWGRYYQPSPAELKLIIEALAMARSAKLLDLETCIEMLSQYIAYKDPEELMKILEEELDKEKKEFELIRFDVGQQEDQDEPENSEEE